MKNKITTIGIIIATIILAGVAVFTAIRLYQLRQESITPVKPTSKPKAQENCPPPKACTALTFKLGGTPTPTPLRTPTPAPGGCNSVCTTDADCNIAGSILTFICYKPPAPPAGGVTATTGNCRISECPTQPDCFCGVATSTPTPSPTAPAAEATSTPTSAPGVGATPTPPTYAAATPTPIAAGGATPAQPALPDAGISLPTILGISLGSLLLIGALLLAL